MASHEQLQTFVDGYWNDEILPTIQDYIRVPNVSPMFDPALREPRPVIATPFEPLYPGPLLIHLGKLRTAPRQIHRQSGHSLWLS